MIKKNISRRDQLENEIELQPVESHVNLLRCWIAIAGETNGPACAHAWQNVRRLSHALEIRAARYARSWRD